MSNEAHKCPKCKQYIIGEYCFSCKINVADYMRMEDMPDFMRDLFGNLKDKPKL